MDLFWNKKRDEKNKLRLSIAAEKLKNEQSSVGASIAEVIKRAANENASYDLKMNNEHDFNLKQITVVQIAENSDRFTMVAMLPSDGTLEHVLGERGYAIYQIDVILNQIDRELHIFRCPYGPEEYYPISYLEEFKKIVYQNVKEFKLYHCPKVV